MDSGLKNKQSKRLRRFVPKNWALQKKPIKHFFFYYYILKNTALVRQNFKLWLTYQDFFF